MSEGSRLLRAPLIASGAILAYLLVTLAFMGDRMITRFYFLTQDRWVAGVMLGGLLVAGLFAHRVPARLPSRGPGLAIVLAGAAILLVFTWWGTRAIMFDYALTRDEVSAWFDSLIYASGVPAMPVEPQWRPFLKPLLVAFQLPITGDVAAVSNYMPVNAAMRAGMALVAESQLLNPLLLGVGFVAAWDAARRLFPDAPEAIWVSLAAYALAAQSLVSAMTPYAMTAHLALDAVWLALFLRDRVWTHVAAMVVGAIAIGIHQIAFHPLFAAPFMLLLMKERRWRLLAAYAVAYAAALLGWLSWQGFVRDFVGAAPPPGAGGAVGGFIQERILTLLAGITDTSLPLIEANVPQYNLLRFFAWMPLFLLPLLCAAAPSAWRRYELPAALFLGIALTFVTISLLLPYQGHGWGYRYLHGLIPNAVLLCGFGYQAWAARHRAQADGVFVLLGAVTLAWQLPFLMTQAHRFVAPHAALTERVDRQAADFLVLETSPPGSALDQVRNRPDFTNRPLVLAHQYLDVAQVQALCRRGTMSLLTRESFGLPVIGYPSAIAEQKIRWLRDWLPRQPCWRPPVD